MRGYQKKAIYIKNTGSQVFEEAYFVVRPDGGGVKNSADMIIEANRIIEENFKNEKKNIYLAFKKNAPAFIIGASVSFLLCIAIYFLTR